MSTKINLPDLSSFHTPDISALADDLSDYASAAVDAMSGVASNVPGLHDYRAAARRRRLFAALGAVALVAVVVAVIRRRRADEPKLAPR